MPMRGICGVILLLACIEVGAERPVRSLLEYRTENLILQQWDNSCAAAALATLLTYEWRRPVTERQVARALLGQTDELRVRTRGGFSLLDMKRYLAGIGITGEGYGSLSLDDLRPFAPAIVPASLRGFDHFVIVREVGATHVAIGDPAFGNYRMTHAAFLRSWSGTAFRLQPLAPLMPGKEQ
ncbi:MAG: cysteine peptidase family C39 domain-containing protein [Burkholderiaceae bacterium]|nr:cysteine peptidase family C39 domain-containing protein [Burkholderiaceae bacterium]